MGIPVNQPVFNWMDWGFVASSAGWKIWLSILQPDEPNYQTHLFAGGSTGSTSRLELRHRRCQAFLCAAQSAYVQKKLDSNAHLLPGLQIWFFVWFIFPFIEVVDPSVSKSTGEDHPMIFVLPNQQLQGWSVATFGRSWKERTVGRRKPCQGTLALSLENRKWHEMILATPQMGCLNKHVLVG